MSEIKEGKGILCSTRAVGLLFLFVGFVVFFLYFVIYNLLSLFYTIVAGNSWADVNSALGRLVYSTFREGDFSGVCDGVLGGKPGMDASAHPESHSVVPTLTNVWTKVCTHACPYTATAPDRCLCVCIHA